MEIPANPPLFRTASDPDLAAGDRDDGAAAASASADFDSFLNLLTAQLRNQDPLQPIDSTQFVAQLASFSTVEQLIGTNERLDTLVAQASDDQATRLSDWIGRAVSLDDGSFRTGLGPVRLATPGEPGADRAVAQVRRPDGALVAELQVSPTAPSQLEWDGTDRTGEIAPAGPATIRVAYFAGEELLADVPAQVYREVSGLLGGSDGPILVLADGGRARPSQVSALAASGPEESDG